VGELQEEENENWLWILMAQSGEKVWHGIGCTIWVWRCIISYWIIILILEREEEGQVCKNNLLFNF
jgi:hypothetical protein